MDDIEIPEYFICPISLQIMRDPVTAITGITYDRQSIEKWLSGNKNKNKNKEEDNMAFCPVSKQPLPRGSDLTPNHTLRRLIQAWCTDNSTDRIPTPKPPLDRSIIVTMIKDLQSLDTQLKVLRNFDVLAAENERNRKYMVEAGLPRALLLFIVAFCYNEGKIEGLEQSLRVLYLIGVPSDEARLILMENNRVLESLTWVLGIESKNRVLRCYTILLLKILIESTSSQILERLKPEVLRDIIGFIRDVNSFTSKGGKPFISRAQKEANIDKHAINSALTILLESSTWNRNRVSMIEHGAVFELIELELNSSSEKRTTEAVLTVLSRLCSSADGRAEFQAHRGGVAVVAKRILRVSPGADDKALAILSMLCKFSPASSVVEEMVEVAAVAKLFMVLQVDCAASLKEKAREILRVYSDEWKRSPCVDHSLITRYTS